MELVTVVWPSSVSTVANVWRVLDLSGLTANPRQSKQALRAGCVYVNGRRIDFIYEVIELNKIYHVKIVPTHGPVREKKVYLINSMTYRTKPRNTEPHTIKRRG